MPPKLCLFAALTLAPLAPAHADAQLPLTASITANEGLVKHLFSFELPPGPQQFIGLTGTVSLATTENHFAEALISVTYMPGGNCAAVNGTSYASYTSPGFPILTHLAAFTLKSSQATTITEAAAIALPHPVRVAPCIVVVLDGGGAWGPNHGNGMIVTMKSSLTLTYATIPPGENPRAIPYAIGGEFGFGTKQTPSGTGLVTIIRVNPTATTGFYLDDFFGAISASAFDGSSGETVPNGPWGARSVTQFYPNRLCGAYFPVNSSFIGPLHVFRATLGPASLPPGGNALHITSLQGTGPGHAQNSFFHPTWPTTLMQGDCLVTAYRVSANGVIDLEDQSTAMLRPINGG